MNQMIQFDNFDVKNDNLEISIKQTDSDGDSVVVWFNAIHAQAVIDAIQRAANEIAEIAAYEDQA